MAAGLGQDVDQVAPDVEQPELEDREQANRSGADDDDVGVDLFRLARLVRAVVGQWSRLSPAGPAS